MSKKSKVRRRPDIQIFRPQDKYQTCKSSDCKNVVSSRSGLIFCSRCQKK